MNNEPVAWMSNGQEFYVQKNYCPDFIPLYIHPASLVDWSYQQGYQVGKETHPAKTLTDEEISDVINNEFVHKFNGYEICFLYTFARAILRKAQEK